MKSITTQRFRQAFARLPAQIKQKARFAFTLWRANPRHPSLRFKKIHETKPIYAVRVGLGWRAVGLNDGQRMVWFWIGSHADYDELISSL